MSEILHSHREFAVGKSTVHVGFTNSAAGNLGLHVGENPVAVLRNRKRLEQQLGLGERPFVYLNQVHGTEVFDADISSVETAGADTEAEAQRVRDAAPVADAAVTTGGVPLAVMVADCIPVVLVGETDKHQPVLAVAHAGRRGLLDGVLEVTVEKMVERGASTVQAWLGPSICGDCYEVPESMRQESSGTLPAVYAETSWHTPALNLPAGAAAVLESHQAVTRVHRDFADCTLENSDLFSHRRGAPLGRIAGLVWIEK